MSNSSKPRHTITSVVALIEQMADTLHKGQTKIAEDAERNHEETKANLKRIDEELRGDSDGPGYAERLRNLEEFKREHGDTAEKLNTIQAWKDAQQKRDDEMLAFKRQVWLLTAGSVLTFLGSAALVWWK